MNEPRFGTWEWIVYRNKRNAKALWFVLKRYWVGSAIGVFGLVGANLGWIDPPGFGVGAFLGWILTAMFLAQDISTGVVKVADPRPEGGDSA